MEKCFACGKPLKTGRHLVDTRDDQTVYVGADCFKKVKAAGEAGYGGKNWKPGYVRLYLMPEAPFTYSEAAMFPFATSRHTTTD